MSSTDHDNSEQLDWDFTKQLLLQTPFLAVVPKSAKHERRLCSVSGGRCCTVLPEHCMKAADMRFTAGQVSSATVSQQLALQLQE